MLSEPSYRQLQFEGRPRRRRDEDVSAVAPLAPSVAGSPRSRREEPPLAHDEQRLVAAALAGTGLDVSAYRSGPLRRRMPAVLRSLRTSQAAAGALRIAAERSLAERALDTLLIGHTGPFRDAETFTELRTRILPELVAGRRGLRAWSVGCSSGVELLSVALLLAELGVIEGSTLQGSDCRTSAIAAARAQSVAAVAAAGREQFGLAEGLAAAPEVLSAVGRIDWRVEDALVVEPRERWDLVLCRNVAIYLNEAASRSLWTRLVAALTPGGVLVTGKAERPPAGLPLVRLAKCIYRVEGATA